MPLKLENISYIYAPGSSLERRALNDVCLELQPGRLWGMTGSAGSGMSTLARVMGGLCRPSEGRLFWKGEEVFARGFDRRAFHSQLALIFEYPERRIFESSAERELGFALRGSALSADERREAILAALEFVGLNKPEILSSQPLSLPLFERRLVSVASALVTKPELIIFDEPFSGLDGREKNEMMALMLRLVEKGCTVLLITRQVDFIAEHAEHVFVFSEGRIIREGTPTAVFSDYYDLLHYGIPVPTVRRCVQLLRERGISMPENVVNYEQFIDRLKILMWRKMK